MSDPLGIFGGQPLVPPWAVRLGLHPPYPGGSFEEYLDPASPYYRADAATAFAEWRGAERAAEAEYEDARQRAERARAEEAGERRRQGSRALAVLSGDPSLTEAIAALAAPHGGLSREVCQATFVRFVDQGAVRPTHELVVVEGRMTVPGYFLSRGTFTSQFGRWKEVRRVPAFLAPRAGRRHLGGDEYSAPRWIEGFDAWLDAEGGLWADGQDGKATPPAHIRVTDHRRTAELIVEPGTSFRTRRRKAPYQGWEMHVPDAVHAYRSDASPESYTRAVAAALRACSGGPSEPRRVTA